MALLLNIHFDTDAVYPLQLVACPSMSLFPVGQGCAVQLFETTPKNIVVS